MLDHPKRGGGVDEWLLRIDCNVCIDVYELEGGGERHCEGADDRNDHVEVPSEREELRHQANRLGFGCRHRVSPARASMRAGQSGRAVATRCILRGVYVDTSYVVVRQQ
jgi:hypothetical protein